MERPMEQEMNMHGPKTGARVRVWGRGARGSPRGGLRRPEGTWGGLKSAERASPEAAVSTPEIGRGGAGLRGGSGGGASSVCRRGVFSLGKKGREEKEVRATRRDARRAGPVRSGAI